MSQLAERYATALFEVTQKKGNTQDCLDTLLALGESLSNNPDILDILGTPLIPENEKEAILKSAVGGALNDELGTFFQLLTKNNRLAVIPQIVTAFKDRIALEQGQLSGTVRSAAKLSDAEKADIKGIIEKEMGKAVELEFNVDATMIGGVEAKVGSYIFEDSIKSHMQKLNDFITRRVQ